MLGVTLRKDGKPPTEALPPFQVKVYEYAWMLWNDNKNTHKATKHQNTSLYSARLDSHLTWYSNFVSASRLRQLVVGTHLIGIERFCIVAACLKCAA